MMHKYYGNLRPIAEEDFSRVLNWRNSANVISSVFSDDRVTTEEHREWFENLGKNNTVFLIFELMGEPVGTVQFPKIDAIDGTSSWGFYLGNPGLPQGTGYMMCSLGLDYAFNVLGLRKLSAKVLSTNNTSLKLHHKLGFMQEGCLREHILKGETYRDIILLAMFKEEFVNELLH